MNSTLADHVSLPDPTEYSPLRVAVLASKAAVGTFAIGLLVLLAV